MQFRIALVGVVLALGLPAAKLPEWYTRTLPDAEFRARLIQDQAQIESVAGDSFEGEVILVQVEVKPLYGSDFTLSRDDFLLRARNNNDTSPAVSPDRIAGAAVLDLTAEKGSSSPGLFAEDRDAPIWAGIPGTGSRPRRLGGPPATIGGGASGAGTQRVDQKFDPEASAADRLQSLELPLELADEPASGYLYFEMPAKVKRKHLELSYDGALGEFVIEFKKPE